MRASRGEGRREREDGVSGTKSKKSERDTYILDRCSVDDSLLKLLVDRASGLGRESTEIAEGMNLLTVRVSSPHFLSAMKKVVLLTVKPPLITNTPSLLSSSRAAPRAYSLRGSREASMET